MGMGTDGEGDDSMDNVCGIAKSHAYSLIGAFTMTDANGNDHDMVMVRNPWGMSTYTGDWNAEDSSWTQDLIDQVPHNIDPTASAADDGIFVAPKEYLRSSYKCMDEISIVHYMGD